MLNNPTYFEVPTDCLLRDVIYELGGGVKNGKETKSCSGW
jgi:NADH:ubiquinone oxidoreductase subunit F (NADH-binding)